jgi:Tc toxin complex TcA C-terminal TcB-binding domain/Neuraminidase-like domain
MDKAANIPIQRLEFLKTVSPDSVAPLISNLHQNLSSSSSAKPTTTTPKTTDVDTKTVDLLLFANEVANFTEQNAEITKGIVAQASGLKSIQDVARNFSHGQLVQMLSIDKSSTKPSDSTASDPDIKPENKLPAIAKSLPPLVRDLQRKLFHQYPVSVLARMIEHGEIDIQAPISPLRQPFANPVNKLVEPVNKLTSNTNPAPDPKPEPSKVNGDILQFLDANPKFDIRQKSVVTFIAENGLKVDVATTKGLKVLQTTQALTHTPEALPGLSKAGIFSAARVVQIPEKTFVSRFQDLVGGSDVAKAIHTHSTNIVIRNDIALTSLLQTARGTGIAMIDGNVSKADRLQKAIMTAKSQPESVDLETLFGSMDICECDDCNSVTSPAAYFVELMQFLRNNNLDPNSKLMAPPNPPNPADSLHTKGLDSIPDGTPLAVLLSRRPDLACLQLTCVNTNTVLPYIDLANEVMESFVVHLSQYSAESPPRTAIIDVFNADADVAEGLGGSTPELLAQPENTNYIAYCILASAVFPVTNLPFNQPVEAIRLFLEFLGTSRAELEEIYRSHYSPATVTVPDTFTSSPGGQQYSEQQNTGGQYSGGQQNVQQQNKGQYSGQQHSRGQYSGQQHSGGQYAGQQQTSEQHPGQQQSGVSEGGGLINSSYHQMDDYYSSSSSEDEDDYGDSQDKPAGTPGTGAGNGNQPISTTDQACLVTIHQQALERATQAERLSLTEEEYIILTKEAFWTKKHFEIRHGETISDDTYSQRIGVRNIWEYWGNDYSNIAQILDQDEAGPQIGLTFVKKQFLPRSGILYAQLVELIQTDFINPNMLHGQDQVIMQAFRLSYKFLQSLIGPGKGKERFIPLVEFIDSPAWKATLKKYAAPNVMDLFVSQGTKTEICHHHHPHPCSCIRRKRLLKWLCQHFDCMGKVTVLGSLLDGLHLPWEALLVQKPDIVVPKLVHVTEASSTTGDGGLTFGDGGTLPGTTASTIPGVADGETLIGKLTKDGKILTWDGKATSGSPLGKLSLNGSVKSIAPPPTTDPAGTEHPWNSTYPNTIVKTLSGVVMGNIDVNSILKTTIEEDGGIPWVGLGDDCDISKDRLQHLDGGSLTADEYDRIQRFLRLWRKLSWTMIELDAALKVLGVLAVSAPQTGTTPNGLPGTQPSLPINTGADDTDWNDFTSSCIDGKCSKDNCNSCSKRNKPGYPAQRNGGDNYANKHKHKAKPKPLPVISPDFLHQLVALKQLSDLTGLDTLSLLTFWGDITTAGSTTTPSLYSRLFLTHNLLGVDQIFKADVNGNYLTASPAPKISDHIPILIAAFQVRLKDFNDLMQLSTPIVEGGLNGDFTLSNISMIYRHILLARSLGVKPVLLPTIFQALDINAFTTAQAALDLMKLWNKLTSSGFTFNQIYYVLTGNEAEPLRPVGPSDRTILQSTMSLYTGLNDIDTQHPDITNPDNATSIFVLQNSQLIYDPTVATQIAGFLDGTLSFQVEAPSSLTIVVPSDKKTLKDKVKYSDGNPATLQVTGQLTADELQQAKALSANPGWADALNRCAKMAATFLKNTLAAVFPQSEQDNSKAKLLIGDVAPQPSADGTTTDPGTGPGKRLYFLQWFLPFLRQRLADKLVIDTLSSAASVDPSICTALLSNIITVPSSSTIPTGQTSITALQALENIKDDPKQPPDSFTGYLIAPTTDSYTIIGKSDTNTQPSNIILNGVSIALHNHSDDDEPSNLWASDPIPLIGGRLYSINLQGLTPDKLSWKTNRTQAVVIPSTSLLGDHVTDALKRVFFTLYKCAIVINTLSLTGDEVTYFQSHPADFDGFDWNKLALPLCQRLVDYINLRNSLPKLEPNLINFFSWANSAIAKPQDLPTKINNVTLWEVLDITALISSPNFNLQQPSDFKNEVNLIKLQKALAISTKIGMPIDSLFDWAKPRIDFWKLHSISESINTAVRAKFKLSDWEVAIKPTFDNLRQLQSNALTSYLINQPILKDQSNQGVFDADSLFEFLLIDTQMCPCMETSRLKQATSSVQLFIQRCFLNLEAENGITADQLDRARWDWMQKYRLWEANRKVFLYPENWIQPSLRDDKSPIYLQLESDLMQKDLDVSTVLDVMKNFLSRLDEVANLEVDAIHVEDFDSTDPSVTKSIAVKLHIFARTRGSPYKFYYRVYDISSATWSPWQDVTVDIPRYEVENVKKMPGVNDATLAKPGGFYLIPFTFNSRLLVAFPQITKVQLKADVPSQTASQAANTTSMDAATPTEYWDIKMGLSELRNGKWTPKQTTSESINEAKDQSQIPKPLPPIGSYIFVARRQSIKDTLTPPKVAIDAYRLDQGSGDPVIDPTVTQNWKPIGRFTFTGSHFGVDTTADAAAPISTSYSDFHFQTDPSSTLFTLSTGSRVISPWQSDDLKINLNPFQTLTSVSYPTNDNDRRSKIQYAGYGGSDPVTKKRVEDFYHPFVGSLLQRIGATDNLDDLFGYFKSPSTTEPLWKQNSNISSLEPGQVADAYGASAVVNAPSLYNELNRPYSLYNWELGFHAPMAIVDRLLQNNQFDLALKVIQYVFDPLSDATQGDTTHARAWNWKPFKDTDASNTIQAIFDSLRPNTADSASGPAGGQINQWRDHPFAPHVVARLRPSAYMKYVAVKYINILIAYGDYYFNQNTLETIPMAIQCYVLASHVYGPPGQQIPKRGKKKIQTYHSLLNQWDAFGNAMVQMEVLFPFSINQIPTETGTVHGVTGLANIFGFAAVTYFCIPDNPTIRALRATIDDRLFKIRHCQDMQGNFRILPLYEPPIDPGLLVAATAAGLSLSNILNDLYAPLPNYKFQRTLKRAYEMCEKLRFLGKAFIRAKEHQDHEALMELKTRHEGVVHAMVLDQKKLTKDEAQKHLDAIQQSRKAPEYRMTHNLKLLGEDLGQIPNIADAESEFQELGDMIEAPIVDSGLKLVASEKEEIEKAVNSLDLKPVINAIETVASEMHVLPTLNAHASPLGVGVATCWGPPNIAKGIQGAAKAYHMVADWLSHQGINASRRQGFVKQNQARKKEANTAGHEIKAVDKQILTQQVRLAVHDADISTQQKTTDNSQEVHDFLVSKYTSAQLYIWTEQQVSSIYYQAYQTAYDLAKKAEMAFRYERGLSDSSTPTPFIKFGYWEPKNDGLLCGDKLHQDLRALESAYQENRGHDFEITKHVSLRAINPLALLMLRGDGATPEFAVPEILYDMDFPGHYGRRLKSVAVTIRSRPDIPTDPYYAQVNCTLSLMSNKFRNSALAMNSGDYVEKTDQDDVRFTNVSHVPITSIVTSSSTQDAGVFRLDFSSDAERFLPFEGAGAISTWKLQLNDAFRTFDYGAIQDVILHISYTALNGGQTLGNAAKKSVLDYVKSAAQLSDSDGLYAVFDIPHDFPTEFAAAKDGSARTFTMAALNTLLPIYTKGVTPDKLTTQDVYVVTDVALTASDVRITVGSTDMTFTKVNNVVGKSNRAMNALHWTDGPAVPIKDWVVTVGQGIAAVSDMLILVRYSMTA